ncbi:MAG TPA: WGxxGxxG family protein [Thermomicrobiales bacterium]|nr:WGxxGxxG family protein [Thermomicrobiales bacterium]
MRDSLLKTSRIAVLGVFLALGVHGGTSVVAQESTVPAAVEDVTEEVDDGGFDDWGLLGLLGLAGLAGLLKRPTQEVRTVERVDAPIR